MKYKLSSALFLSAALLQGCNGTSEQKDQNGSEVDTVSYSIGYNIGTTIAKQDSEMSLESVVVGLKDGYSGTSNPKFSEEEMQQAMLSYAQKKQGEIQKKREETATMNAEEGKAFLEQNKKKEGVKELESGLQYKIVKEGDGPVPSAEDTVVVEYTGKFIDGKVFSSSAERGMPATFKVSQVIPAWTEALQKMPKGSTWELYVPSKLAYGEQGAGEVIGPNTTLLFTVELVDIKSDEKDSEEE